MKEKQTGKPVSVVVNSDNTWRMDKAVKHAMSKNPKSYGEYKISK